LVSGLYQTDKNLSSFELLGGSAVKSGNELLNLYRFYNNRHFELDTGAVQNLYGTFRLEDSILILKDSVNESVNRYFTATQITDSSFYMITDFPDKRSDKLAWRFAKIQNDEGALQLPANDWKTTLTENASDAVIKNKLIAILQHYEQFYTTINNTGCTVFSQTKLLLPLKLYAGAIGTKELNETPAGFITIMGSQKNAQTALTKLREAFNDNYQFPNLKNYILEYAAVFHHLAQRVR
jgi:hypothetical protein